MELLAYPSATLTVGGPHRWQGQKIRITLENSNHYFFNVPDYFAAGTEDSVELIIGQRGMRNCLDRKDSDRNDPVPNMTKAESSLSNTASIPNQFLIRKSSDQLTLS